MSDESQIRHLPIPPTATVSTLTITDAEVIVPTRTLMSRPRDVISEHRYRAPMTTASAVAAALRDRLPNVADRKLHALLYFAQAHHLAVNHRPLFTERIAVVGDAILTEGAGTPGGGDRLADAALAMVDYVIARYGTLTGLDLSTLALAQEPARDAVAKAGNSRRAVLDLDGMGRAFRQASEHPDGRATPFSSSDLAAAMSATGRDLPTQKT
ncbi:hypothetical protein [Actinoplanes sp. NPDC051494]|uniref:hypothetical protein n=1 Tax=Actinoplanes sp. NPDC051494 TaxID=3363907 RepID=UPI0037AB74BA